MINVGKKTLYQLYYFLSSDKFLASRSVSGTINSLKAPGLYAANEELIKYRGSVCKLKNLISFSRPTAGNDERYLNPGKRTYQKPI